MGGRLPLFMGEQVMNCLKVLIELCETAAKKVDNQSWVDLETVVENLIEEWIDTIKNDVTLELNNHKVYEKYPRKFTDLEQSVRFGFKGIKRGMAGNIEMLVRALATGDEKRIGLYKDVISNNNRISILGYEHLTCKNCSEHFQLYLDLDTNVVKPCYIGTVGSHTCQHSDGIGSYSVKLRIKSGRLVVANAIFRLLDDESDSFDKQVAYSKKKTGIGNVGLDSEIGQKCHSEYYADVHKIAYIPATNTSVTGFKDTNTGEISYKMGGWHRDENLQVDGEYYVPNSLEAIGGVSCDVWAVTAMDYDDFTELCTNRGISFEDGLNECDSGHVLTVKTGVYEFVVHKFKPIATEQCKETLFTIKHLS